MTPVPQFGNQTITAAEALKLLAGYQMLPQLCRFLIIDQAITSLSSANAPILLLSEEKTSAIEQYYENNQLTTPAQREAWLKHYGMSGEQLESLATRELRIEKFKQATWGSKIESYFLQYKPQLDKVVYSLLRTSDAEAAQELYFRI